VSAERRFSEGFYLRLPAILIASFILATPGSVWSTPPAAPDDASLEIVGKYLDATRTQQDVLRGAQMEMNVHADLPKLGKQGTLRALRIVSKFGKITYKALGFSGDSTVKQEVIARYLQAESEARENGSIAISPQNYKFRLKATVERDNQKVFVFQLTPKKKAIGLFKGELWLDAATGMPLKESGEFVKTPSVFLKKVEFVRDYEIHDGVAIPSHIESTVDTRLVGRAELSILFTNLSYPDTDYDLETASGH
jgi:hypothetical protein